MAAVFSLWMRRKASPSARPAKRRALRKYTPRLLVENLEDRTLLSWTVSNGQTPHTYTGVREVVFHGGGNDRFTTAPGFTIPIQADAPSGNAFLQGGDGGNTLVGGSGNDTLVGGKGIDSITGGSGSNILIGGGGNDILRSTAGTDQIFGGSGNDQIFGGSGDDSIYAGGGNDTIHGGSGVYLIDGGSGNDVIYGDAGHAAKMINGVLTYPVIHGGPGNTVIYGPTAPAQLYGDSGSDTITGGPGVDTIYAGTGGNNVIHGGGGNDVIFGGTGNDSLYGDGGNCTIYGGTGTEYLYGGDGQNLQINASGTGLINAAGDGLSHGNSLLIAGPGNDVLYGDSTGHNTLHAGAGHDTLFAGSGGDYLAAGTGPAALIGGPGDDSLQIEFVPIGRQQPQDTIVGGAGNNTLILKGTAQDNKIYFTQVAGTIGQFHATLNDLDSGASLGQVTFTMPPDVEQVALEGGPGNNVIQVDPSVTRDMFVYGGPGNNTIYGGSGNDTLVGGLGSSVIYGGSGDSLLYGGDMPTQDHPPMLDSSGTVTMRTLPPGHNTLIAGGGNDELFAGPGGDVLIGGSAVLQNGQFVLVPGAGRDVLEGGAGNDLLIAGPGSPGAVLFAGTGSSVLVSDNVGANSLDAGNSTGANLLLGGNLGNNIRGGAGNDTLVGGLGIDYILAGSGNQVLSADPSAAYWSQAQVVAAAHHVVLGTQPNPFQGDPVQLFQQLYNQLNATGSQILTLEHLRQTVGLTPGQESQLEKLLNEDQLLSYERADVDHILGASVLVDSLVGGPGTDQLYGGAAATWMAGDTLAGSNGNTTFYNYNGQDTIQGGHGTNTLMFQADGTTNLTHVMPNGQDAVNVAINGQQWTVGNLGHISGIQVIGVQLLTGTDTVTVNFGAWAGLQLYVASGSGTDVIDARSVQAQETLLGGTGNDTIKIGTQLATGSLVRAGSGYNELDIQGSNAGDTVTVSGGVLTVDGVRVSGAGFQKLVVLGGSGTNTFTSDGSIPSLVLQGGTGTNTFSVTGGTATLIGGHRANNSFKVTGSGDYTVLGGTPTALPAAPVLSGVNAPPPAGLSQSTASLTQARYDMGVATVGTKAIFAGGYYFNGSDYGVTNVVNIYDASTGQWSTATLFQAREGMAVVVVGTKAIFAGGYVIGANASNAVDIYDASTNTWTRATLSQARGDIAVAVAGTRAIFVGGFSSSTLMSNAVDIYDANAGAWSSTTVPARLTGIAATTVGTKALFAGGVSIQLSGFFLSNAVYIYDSSTGTWSTSHLSRARAGMTAMTLGTKAFFAGGQADAGNDSVSNVVDIYDASKPSGQEWSSGTLAQAREGIAATAVGTKAVFAGGSYLSGSQYYPSNVVDIYDATTGQWSTASLSQPRTFLAVTPAGTRAIFAGGYNGNGGTNAVDIYDAATGQWSTATLSQARSHPSGTTVGTKAIFAGGFTSSNSSNVADIFTFPPATTVTSVSSSLNGNATIGYKLFDNDAHASSIQVQYSVNGGLWQVATPGPGGDGTSNLASSLLGTAHTFVWNTAHDLGNTDNPSVRVRITPMDAIGTGVTQASGSFSVDNAGVVNALTIAFTDSNNDTVHLVQSGSTITISGTMIGTASNMTSFTVLGGTGRNLLDASGMIMPVTLNGGAGSGADTLMGGAGSDTLYYSGTGSTYIGGSGANDEIVYPANNGDIIAFLGSELIVNGVARNLGNVSRIENFLVAGNPASVNDGQQRLWPFEDIPLTNAAISSLAAPPSSAATVLTAHFTDANANASTATESATVNWGDGTTSTGTITSNGGGNFTITANHVYATNGTHPVIVTIIDSQGAATTAGTTFTGGLELEANSDLRNYAGTNFTLADTGVKSFVVRNADVTAFTLHTDGSLFAIPGTSGKQAIDGGVQAMFLGLDNVLYDLHGGGTLYTVALGSIQLHFGEANVQTLLQDTGGNLYKLHTDGSLFALTPTSNWGQVAQGVKSIALTSDSSAVYMLKADGAFWQLSGTTLTFLEAPHLQALLADPVTAGAANALQVTAFDHYGNVVTGYRGTVHFTSSDAQATLPADYTFTAADNGVHTFMVTLKTAGSQSILTHDVSGTLPDFTRTVTVRAASAALLVLSGSPRPLRRGWPAP